MKKMFKYLDSCVRENTGVSSKAFSLILSSLVGSIIALCLCGVLIADVAVDGVVDTDLSELGIFLMADGVFMVGGSASKTFSERWEKKDIPHFDNFEPNETEEN